LNATENGLPDSEIEFPRLNNIEDNFSSETKEIRFFASVAGGNVARYIFCYNGFENKTKIEHLVDDLVGNSIKETYYYQTKLNDDFSYYEAYIVPNAYEWQHMLNRNLCFGLQDAGDNFSTPRDIDFLFVFDSDVHLNKISDNLTDKEFREIRREKMENGKYDLELILNDVPTWENMNGITDYIVDLLKDTDGYFDGWGCPVHKT